LSSLPLHIRLTPYDFSAQKVEKRAAEIEGVFLYDFIKEKNLALENTNNGQVFGQMSQVSQRFLSIRM